MSSAAATVSRFFLSECLQSGHVTILVCALVTLFVTRGHPFSHFFTRLTSMYVLLEFAVNGDVVVWSVFAYDERNILTFCGTVF